MWGIGSFEKGLIIGFSMKSTDRMLTHKISASAAVFPIP